MNKSLFLFSFFIVSICINNLTAQNLSQLGKSSIKEVVAAMTLEEKTKLVVGNGLNMPGMQQQGVGITKDKVPGASGKTFAILRLGIRSIVVADGPPGLIIDSIRNDDHSKTYYATAWPVATLLASTWDTALVKKVGASSADIRLQATFNLPGEIVVEKVNKAFSPKTDVNELKKQTTETGTNFIEDMNGFAAIGR